MKPEKIKQMSKADLEDEVMLLRAQVKVLQCEVYKLEQTVDDLRHGINTTLTTTRSFADVAHYPTNPMGSFFTRLQKI